MVCDIRECDDSSIIGRRQIVVVHRAESFAADAAEVKFAYGTSRVRGQCIQQSKLIEDPLSVRLENFAAQSLRWTGGLLQYDRLDALLRQSEGKYRPATTGSNHRNVGFFNHSALSQEG
jgi:hypothetical protein